MARRLGLLSLLFVTALGASFSEAADWPFFRGPNRDGLSPDAQPPLHWSKQQNIRWGAKLPGPGNSSPIVTGNKVLLTCALDRQGTRRALLCFDRADGHPLWTQTVNWQAGDPTHATNPYCASTPATDGQRVIAWHGAAGLYCYDLDGKPLWKADLGLIRHIWGYASSPLIHGTRVYLNCGPGHRSFVVCLDKNTGEKLWLTDEPGGAEDKSPETKSWIGSWSSGVIRKIDGQEQFVVAQPRHVNAYDLASGKILWTCSGTGDLAYTDVIVGDDIAVAMAGYGGAAIGFKPGGTGDTTASHRLWRTTQKIPQRIGTGILRGHNLFIANEPGLIECIDATSGKTVWSHREPGQNFWALLAGTNDRLYATSQQGNTYVFAPDPAAWRLLATNAIEEHINASPALVERQLFLRTWENLYCIEER
ncbi:MAG TPA: PQQ-binding-like beta-propeller repeat protein [Tepidisphaeraceae bacterium]|jgi:outer membrane protein assembly factor BamB